MMFFCSLTIVLAVSISSTLANATPLPLSPASRLAVPPAPAVLSADSSADQYYAEAIRRMAANDPVGAELAFKRALEKQPGHANALLGLAEIAFKNNQPESAEKLIRQAVHSAPENAHAQASLGRLLAINRKYPEAELALKKAVELDSKLIRPRMDLADLYATALLKPGDALSLYQQVLKIEPNHAGANYAYGVVLMRLGDLGRAQAAFEKSARLESGNPLPPLALGRLNLQQKKLNEAMTWLERSLKIQPALAEALELRGDIQQARNSSDKALGDYAAAIRSQPNLISALLKQGALQQQLGRLDAAVDSYMAVIKINPKLALAYNNLAWLAAERGKNLEQAEIWSKKAIELNPENADFRDTLAWVKRAQGDLAGASELLERVTAEKTASAEQFYHLGIVRSEAGQKIGAVEALRKSLQIDPGFPQARDAGRRLRQLEGR